MRRTNAPTIVDVAKEAGVGTTSVTRFLSPKKRMELSQETRDKIERAILKLGYLPNLFAQKKRSKKRKVTLGILIAPSKDVFRSRYHTEILDGILERAAEASNELKFFLLQEHHYDRLEEIFYEHGVDGLFVMSWRCHPKIVDLVEKSSGEIPLVVFNDYEPVLRVNALYTDVKEGIRQAVTYLVEKKGRRSIGLLAGPTESLIQERDESRRISSPDAKDKRQSFFETMKEKGIPIREDWILECPSYAEGQSYQTVKDWIAKIDKKNLPEALIAMNDEIALDAWRALKDAEKWPGQMIDLIGFDDIEKGRLVSPSLTTVRQPLRQMGRDAVDILFERVKDPKKVPVQSKYLPELVIRQTA